MQIRVDRNLTVELADPDDFRRFEVQVDLPLEQLERVRVALRNAAELEGASVAWVSVEWVAISANRSDELWRAGFQKMLEYAQSKGWSRAKPFSIRGHIIWAAS